MWEILHDFLQEERVMPALQKRFELTSQPFGMVKVIVVPLAEDLAAGVFDAEVAQGAERNPAGMFDGPDVRMIEAGDMPDEAAAVRFGSAIDEKEKFLVRVALATKSVNAGAGGEETLRNGQCYH
jgi:hypothetical protein